MTPAGSFRGDPFPAELHYYPDGGRDSAGDEIRPGIPWLQETGIPFYHTLFCSHCGIPNLFHKNATRYNLIRSLFFCSMRVPPSLPQRGRQPKGCAPLTPVVISKIFKQHSCPARPRLGGQATPKGGGPAHIRDYFGKSIWDRTRFYSHKQTSIILYFFAANLSENI